MEDKYAIAAFYHRNDVTWGVLYDFFLEKKGLKVVVQDYLKKDLKSEYVEEYKKQIKFF